MNATSNTCSVEQSERIRRTGRAAAPCALGIQMIGLAMLATVLAVCAGDAALAKEPGRAVVVSPDGPEVPIAPDEKVGAVTVVPLAGGPVAVVRVDKMPAKPKFNVITPAGVSHPYTDGPTGAGDITVKWSYTYIHAPNGDYWHIEGVYTKPGVGRIGRTWKDFPPGSQLVPDPPQPPGLWLACPDAYPALPDEETLVLAELGMPDNPGTEVWWVPSSEFHFYHDAWPIPEIVLIGAGSPVTYISNDVATPAPAPMSLVWRDDFDEYPPFSGLHGQGGWKGWGGDPALDAFVTDVQSRSAPQAVEVAGGSDIVHEFDGADSGRWQFTAWQYIPSDFTSGGGDLPGSYIVMMNTYSDAGPWEEGHWSIQMNFDSNDGMLKVYYGNGLNTVNVPYDPDRWVKVQAVIDLDDDWTQIYYDDDLVTEYPWTGGVLGGGGGASDIAIVDLYANGSTPIYYDDLKLKPKPD